MKIDPRRLLRLYPRAWRERYGEELLALVGDRLSWRAAIDIGRAAIAEWTFGGHQTMTPTILGGLVELGRDLNRDLIPWLPWRAAAVWGIALGAGFVIGETNYLLNSQNPFFLNLRGLVPPWTGFAICFLAGFHGAWRKDFGHGGLVALLAILIGFVVAIAGNIASVLLVSRFRAIDLSHELYWALEVPLPVMFMVGGFLGTVGAAIGAGVARLRSRAV